MLTELRWIRIEWEQRAHLQPNEAQFLAPETCLIIIFRCYNRISLSFTCNPLLLKIPINCILFHPVELFPVPIDRSVFFISFPSCSRYCCWTQLYLKGAFSNRVLFKHSVSVQFIDFFFVNFFAKIQLQTKFSTRVTLIAFARNELNLCTCGHFWIKILCCAYIYVCESPNGKAFTVIAHQSSICIVTQHWDGEEKKSEDYSTSIVNVCFAHAARTHDENDN